MNTSNKFPQKNGHWFVSGISHAHSIDEALCSPPYSLRHSLNQHTLPPLRAEMTTLIKTDVLLLAFNFSSNKVKLVTFIRLSF